MDYSAITKLSESPYTPLDAAQREIRLLELLPGDHDSDLVLKLHVHALEEKRARYVTLSYVWGEKPCPRPALVNGKQLAIGRNLDCALRHIRDNITELLGTSLLWVDALCIDQTDLKERNHQVGLMGQIYSSAGDMVIWLGPERPDTEFIMDKIKDEELPEGLDVLPILDALKRLCLRPWFGRLWIAQELALSSDPLILVGNQSLRWDIFHKYVEKISVKVELEKDKFRGEDRLIYAYVYFNLAAERVRQLQAVKQDCDQDGWIDLVYQLERTRALLASDPRDKVYGLLNISESFIKILPDYTKSVQQVFAEATAVMLSDGYCPYSFFALQPPFSDVPEEKAYVNRIADLPSWALDLTIGTRSSLERGFTGEQLNFRNIEARGRRYNFKLRPGISRYIEVDDQFLRLSVPGKHLGTIIETTGNLFENGDPALYTAYLRINKAREVSTRAFVQAVSGGRSGEKLCPEEVANQARVLHDTIGPEGEYLPNHEYASWAVSQTSFKDTVVFVTVEGHVGRAYHPELGNGIRAGDVVVGLFGTNYPCILRKVRAEDEQESVYTMVNIAYIAFHRLGHAFVESAPRRAKWKYFEKHGLRKYTIV